MEMINEVIPRDMFGELSVYLADENITDINYNGESVWVDHIYRGRYRVDIELSDDFINTFVMKIKNSVSKNFNIEHNVLEAETDQLRISIIHQSVAKTGTAISIRKTPPEQRMNHKMMVETGYCGEEIIEFLKRCVQASCNIIISGTTGSGKTELLKWMTNFIAANEKVITIEDNLEIHYRKINPGKDCIELKVDERLFNYSKAIKTSLRQLPQWIILSEARSIEVKYLLETFSTGHNGITTIHCDDVRKIPKRIKNMIQDDSSEAVLFDDIFNFIDIGILITKRIINNEIVRTIEQICVYDFVAGKRETIMIYERDRIPLHQNAPKLIRKFENLSRGLHEKENKALLFCSK